MMKNNQSSLFSNSVIFFFLLSILITSTRAQIISESEKLEDKYQVKYRITQLDSPIQEILWCGTSQAKSEDGDIINFDSPIKVRKLYILSEKGQLYISNDYGITLKWINQEIISTTNASLQNVTINDIMLSPANNKKVFFFGTAGQSFYTNNCGSSYKTFKHDVALTNIDPNKGDAKLLIGLVPLICSLKDPECTSSTSNLMLSSNSGNTWKQIGTFIEQAQWDKTKQILVNTQNRIIIAHYENSLNQKGLETNKRKISYSDNFGVTYILVENQGLRFYQNEEYIFILTQQKIYGEYKLLIGSSMITQSAGRSEIDLPLKRVKDESFTVLNTDQGSIMISINHENDDTGYTNVYISNSEGKKFTISLQQNQQFHNIFNNPFNTIRFTVSDSEQTIDFEPISSNYGTFIANMYSPQIIKKNQQIEQKKQSQKSTSGESSQVDKFNIKDTKKTKISFNKGGDWHNIKAPVNNIFGNPYKCSGECSLNLKGRTEKQGTQIYSTSNAPGVILATGNVGPYLSNNAEDIRTYLSVDGGHNWTEIKSGSHEYEIADQGGIICMARDDVQSSEVIYSIDEGETWRSLEFPKEHEFQVNSFITEDSNEERSFLFYGQKQLNGTTVGVVGALNFFNLFKKLCKGFDTPNEANSDYEKWIPENYSGKKCLFGSKITYIRKKINAQCFNKKSISELRKDLGSCECTQEDFECEYGFIKDTNDLKKCVPLSKKFDLSNQNTPPIYCKNFYTITQGYRKLSNNICKGGYEEMYAPKQMKCPTTDIEQQTLDAVKVDSVNSERGFNEQRQKEEEQIQGKELSSGISFLNLFCLFTILFIFYKYRQEIVYKLKAIQKSYKVATQKGDTYGYQRPSNNAEQYSLFQNEDNEDECDLNSL